MRLLIATHNLNKLTEIRAIFSLPSLELVTLNDFSDLPDVVEDGATFEANAIKKAVAFACAARLWTIADDSGLGVDALNGAPGVYSARYAGEPVSYEANNVKLLNEMKNITNRKAVFQCVIALASPDGKTRVTEGKCKGQIIHSLRGRNGFGYDPLFVPDGYNQTFAEMKSSLKNKISHRAIALSRAHKKWGAPENWSDGVVEVSRQ